MVAEEPVVIAGRAPFYGVRHATKGPSPRAATVAHTLSHNGRGGGVVGPLPQERSHTWRAENGGDRSPWWAAHEARRRGTRRCCPSPAARCSSSASPRDGWRKRWCGEALR